MGASYHLQRIEAENISFPRIPYSVSV